MRGPDGRYGIWDYMPRDNEFYSRKLSSNPLPSEKLARLNPFLETQEKRKGSSWMSLPRLTGHIKFKKSKSVEDLETLNKQVHIEDDTVTCAKHFKEYCSSTSLHGYRYIAEPKRTFAERLFWACWCMFGIISACYMMSKIWSKWAKNPVLTSVATTNYPVTNVIFPAVTICTVNKAVTEKLIIQGCRYNYTLSQMKTIISMLVDPDARNNDHFNSEKVHVKPETVLKYLRLVAPKCDDYLLTCRWNSAPVNCRHIFRLTLTDSGYCCTFNAIQTKKSRKDAKHDLEVMIQEEEFDFLQKAVWDYTDNFRDQNGGLSQMEVENSTNPADSFNCIREYDDDLFPGICQYLQKCRESPSCQMKNRPKITVGRGSSTDSPNSPSFGDTSSGEQNPLNIFKENFPLQVAGAGRSRGLTLMLDTLRCDSVPTDSFKGLRILVHNADDFPAVAERGLVVGPGMENQIAVTAVETYSAQVLHEFSSATRGCFFPNEFPLNFYTEYSRSACVVECETEFISRECGCARYFAPGNYSVCSMRQYIECVKKAIDVIQKKSAPMSMMGEDDSSIFQFKSKKETLQEKSCAEFCLPACNETFYNVFVTSADFPNQPQANQTKMIREAILEGHTHLNDIAYVSGSISVVRVFFRESSIMQYKRDELFTWEDFVSNLGGVMSLCLGFSILSLVEVFYFFTMRMSIDKRRSLSHPSNITIIGSNRGPDKT
ncbi:unnamed protein product [Orchesella dallaii]|uniref:Pickpocket protein 28 n=1 Tax=Orchesella dallaii TaxID=48710 RepID=A0ABP1QT89_9HEXA